MLPISEKTIRASFVNASRKEITDITLPAEFADLDWGRLDFLGWRDRRIARRAYIVVPGLGDGEDELVGVMLQQAKASPQKRAQCSWCQDVTLPNDVVFFGARLAGSAGRNGDTAGTLVCADFECSANVRRKPPVAYIGFDVEAAREERMLGLRLRSAAFAATVAGTA
ncbi:MULTISPECIES: FBP domain-containing protein [unclassified Leifsonia]|uniref:FBP domain-containing protein n=1 Tax=unclassified Leifsonia TaxID=2663824 RepID=UPI0006FE1673|nr:MULTISPECIES: FBP domain-containing protein [unclassified Leifsonia]KQX05059.1 translation elongation factor [Leifsonia sp. Root1293]KRA08691.1 translation elongation factor [Leifsonia sp. Root60]